MKIKNPRAGDRRESHREGEKLPFFARFLEKQDLSRVAGGNVFETMKYPSDSDEA